jgi:NAD(P)-dependent dehydrogenase (short-subunit alcohol dehydrogenase family)
MSKLEFNLRGRVAIVTGAAQGIGESVAEALAAEGVRVAALDIKEQTLQQTVNRISQKHPDQVIGIRTDMSNPSDIQQAVERVVQEWSGLDIVVNCAAIAGFWSLEEMTLENWKKVLDVNLTGPMLLCKYAIPYLAKGGKGSIINITSIGSDLGAPGASAYSASKGGLQSLTRVLAVELAPKGIRVNAIAPHIIKTPLTELLGTEEDLKKFFLPRIPLGRFGEPQHVAAAVLFLASDLSEYTTGATYNVNGGISAML